MSAARALAALAAASTALPVTELAATIASTALLVPESLPQNSDVALAAAISRHPPLLTAQTHAGVLRSPSFWESTAL